MDVRGFRWVPERTIVDAILLAAVELTIASRGNTCYLQQHTNEIW